MTSERVRRIAAVCRRIGERLDDLVELHDRARPAVGDEKRHRVRVAALAVNEVDVETVDGRGELREAVEVGFAGAPIVVVQPVVAQFVGVGEGQSLAPVVRCFGVRPACFAQALAQVVKFIVADVDSEVADFAHVFNPVAVR